MLRLVETQLYEGRFTFSSPQPVQDFNKSKVSRFFPSKPGSNSSSVSGWMFTGMLVGDAGFFLGKDIRSKVVDS